MDEATLHRIDHASARERQGAMATGFDPRYYSQFYKFVLSDQRWLLVVAQNPFGWKA